MKVVVFSDRPFGLRGTPGTYLFVAKILKYLDVLVFAPIGGKDIVFSADNIPIYPVKNLTNKTALKEIISTLRRFDPDILYIINFAEWYYLVSVLKEAFPTKKYILDIKTPLLIEHPRRQWIQDEGTHNQHYLDAIVSLSEASVRTWLLNCYHEPLIYPLGIDLSLFHCADYVREKQRSHRMVYIGVLHAKRQIDVLLYFFKDFVWGYSRSVSLDIYGSGPEEAHLRKIIASHSLGAYVRLGGLWPQKDLLKHLSAYDAGIAWVPYTHYDNSPSLKVLEYMAAGIPVLASDTNAHKALVDQGLVIDLFANDTASFSASLQRMVDSGFSSQGIEKNRVVIKRFDYDAIIQHYFLPLFAELLRLPASAVSKHGPVDLGSSLLEAHTNHRRSDTFVGSVKAPQQKRGALKLLLLCDSLAHGKGGAERVATETANAMSHRDHAVYMAYVNTGPPTYRTAHGVILLPYASMNSLRTSIREINPDVFFAFYFDRNVIQWYSLIHDTDIPFGMQECTNPERLLKNNVKSGKLDPEAASWEREIIASAAARIRLTMSDYTFSFPDYIRPSVRAFPNPASPQRTYADPAGSFAERKVIINIGGMKGSKNLITLLHAFRGLASTFLDWDLKVFGKSTYGGAPHEREISDFIKANRLENRVKICGLVDDIFAEFAAAHIHVISSLSEGCPTCVLEAMATGVPSIGFADCTGTNQLIRHRENGLLASPEDRIKSLENALRQLMGSVEIRVRLGRQALKDSRAFCPDKIYDQWEALFYEAAEYKSDPARLLREQKAIDPERAAHVQRCRKTVLARVGGLV